MKGRFDYSVEIELNHFVFHQEKVHQLDRIVLDDVVKEFNILPWLNSVCFTSNLFELIYILNLALFIERRRVLVKIEGEGRREPNLGITIKERIERERKLTGEEPSVQPSSRKMYKDTAN